MEPILVTTVEKDTADTPLLIIDHKGIVGNEIYERVAEEIPTVFVSNKQPNNSANLIYIPYTYRIPEIPNGDYSMIVFISDNEKDIAEITKKCILKAQTDAIPFIFIVDHTKFNQKLVEKILESYEETYIIVLGELFGLGDTYIDSYILQAGTTGTIKLPRMGLRKTRPVLFTDAIQGILQTLFGSKKRQRVTFIYPHHEYTDLSIVHMLQKVDPMIHIDFLKDRQKSIFPKQLLNDTAITMHGSYVLDSDYPIQVKVIDVYKTVSAKKRSAEDSYVYAEEMKPLIDLHGEHDFFPEHFKKWGGLVGAYLLILIMFPLICLSLSSLIGHSALKSTTIALEKGDMDAATRNISLAHTMFSSGNSIKIPTVLALRLIGLSDVSQKIDTSLIVGRDISRNLGELLHTADSMSRIMSGASRMPGVDSATVVSHVRAALVSLQNLSITDTGEKDVLIEMGKYQKGISLLTGTIGLFPEIIASDTRRTYLVLFQDNMELRAGGGVISSYGLVTFDHGKVINFTIHDVSDADTKLHTHIDPSFPLRRYTGIAHQYLRDSTIDPDFVIDAQQASDVFQKATGQKIDGVMAIDKTYTSYMLSAIGSVTVEGQKITADNFVQKALQHEKKDTGSTISQRNDFLLTIFTAIQHRIEQGSNISISTLVQKSLQAIQEKHLLFAVANITSQNQLTVNQLSSSLWDSRPQNSGIINDYMGISESNVGGNKANYFMKRQIKQSVSIDGDGVLKGEVHLIYTNTGTATGGVGGDYKNYLRIIVPKDTILTGISFNGQAQATRSAIIDPLLYESRGFKAPSELEVEQTQEFGKTLYGFLVTIPGGSEKTVDIMYEHAQKINLSNPVLHYSLYVYKQPGTKNDPFSFSFNFPLEYSILSAKPTNGDGNSDYTLDTQLSADKIIDIQLTKK